MSYCIAQETIFNVIISNGKASEKEYTHTHTHIHFNKFFLKSKHRGYSRPPTYKPSSCELSKMRTCICLSSHVSQFTCLAYMVTCVHRPQVAVLLCTLLYSTVCRTIDQYLFSKPRMSRNKHKSSRDVAATAKKLLHYPFKVTVLQD